MGCVEDLLEYGTDLQVGVAPERVGFTPGILSITTLKGIEL